MLHLRLSAAPSRSGEIERALAGITGVERVLAAPSVGNEAAILEADVEVRAADELVKRLHELGVRSSDYVLHRLEVVAPIPTRRALMERSNAFAWVEVLGEARANSRPLARYLALMAVAGTVAATGVINSNAVLLVGAMAVSPDLLPVCASCVGIVGTRWRLAARSLATLLVGLGLVGAVAMAVAAGLRLLDILPADFVLPEGGVTGEFANLDYSTVLVALTAGVAAMLSFETRAAAVVGVAISVATIPASAYFGVAFGLGEASNGLGALLVLASNVTLLTLAGSLTLGLQRLAVLRPAPIRRRRGPSGTSP